jgi:LysM repeat protein
LLRTVIVLGAVLLLVAVPSLHPSIITAQGGGTTHTVQAGENLFRIALRYGLTAEYLAAVNGINNPAMIYVGQVLTIPDAAGQPAPAAPVVDPASAPPVVDPAAVQPAPVAAPVTTSAPVYHTVQPGETLASIGRLYGLSWADIAAANGLTNPNTIYGGQQLLIPGSSAPGTAAVAPPVTEAPPAAAPAANPGTHTVQRGEHLAAIARMYGLTWPTLARANNITDPNTIYAGQVLTLPAADDGQGGYIQPQNVTAPSIPVPTLPGGKQIIVDISDQRVYAYENGQLVNNVLVSTGEWYAPTVLGDYSIYLKYDSQAMSGPGYYLPGVPWVMYFYQGYSLHGTYWHSNFGQPMSHGCVNLPTPEALWFYQWAPIGTPVHVQA